MQYHGCLVATPVRNYPDTHRRIHSVRALDIIMLLQTKTTRVGVDRLSFAPKYIRVYSLHSCRAMVMHIAEVLDCTLVSIV